jgi:hypothetical protein
MSPNFKLWFDDIRRPPDESWIWARTVEEAKGLVRDNPVFAEASLDHDMGLHGHDPDEPDADLRIAPDTSDYEDGMTFVRWLCETGKVPPVITVHSWNPDAARRMGGYLVQWAEVTGNACSVTVRQFDPAVRRREAG